MLWAIMGISARDDLISGQASTGRRGHQCSHAPGRPILHLVSNPLADLGRSTRPIAQRPRCGLTDRGDMANAFIAKRIIELSKTGERNPDVLCEGVLEEFLGHVSL
jgi:hypothetical protein